MKKILKKEEDKVNCWLLNEQFSLSLSSLTLTEMARSVWQSCVRPWRSWWESRWPTERSTRSCETWTSTGTAWWTSRVRESPFVPSREYPSPSPSLSHSFLFFLCRVCADDVSLSSCPHVGLTHDAAAGLHTTCVVNNILQLCRTHTQIVFLYSNFTQTNSIKLVKNSRICCHTYQKATFMTVFFRCIFI